MAAGEDLGVDVVVLDFDFLSDDRRVGVGGSLHVIEE